MNMSQSPYARDSRTVASSLLFRIPILTFLLQWLLPSCQSGFPVTAARFIIVNETNSRVDSLHIEPDEKPSHWSLDPGDSMVYLSEMDKHPLVDGSYRLTFKFGGEKKGLAFGYFSNGMPSERGTRILLRPDTVFIRHVY
jgi:hypothetical protein